MHAPTSPTHTRASERLPLLDSLGAEHPGYTPLFQRSTSWLNAEHEAIAHLPVDGAVIRTDVQGFLRPADALVLYELAYSAQGDVLELGSAWGLSTRILGQAIRSAGRRACVASIEIDPGFQQICRQTMHAAGLDGFYESLAGSAEDQLPPLVARKRPFGMAFVDHDHSRPATLVACAALATLLLPGGFAVFHDFNDARNRDEPAAYGVYQGVCEWLANSPDFVFVGVVGCCGLVQRRVA